MWYHWHSTLIFLIVVLLADFARAAVHWDEMLVKHTWNDVPANWECLGNATAGATIKLYIALQPDRESALVDTLSEVSNPNHPRYGAYLSKEQVAELVSPHQDTLDLVRAWLMHHGIQPSSISTSHGGSWLTVKDVLVSQANQLLGASYRLYRHSKTNDTTIRTVGYALPAVLHSLIQTVAPTTYFPSRRGMRQTLHRRSFGAAQVQTASGKVVTARQTPDIQPSILRSLYNTETYKPLVPGRNMIGILGIDDDYPSPSDLAVFMARYRSDATDADFTVKQYNDGGYNPRRPGVEASISIQYASAIAYPTPLVFYSVGGDAEWDRNGKIVDGDMYLEWFWALIMEQDIPQTIIIPYGHLEQNLPIQYAQSVCKLFEQLGGRGISVLVSSGNDGVGDEDCENDIGNIRFKPEFPASCQFVTSVGGTAFFHPESAANLSGGGFSFFFPTPNYQRTAVTKYLEKYPGIYNGFYNPIGRGYPDVSAQALNCEYIINGEMFYADGTTCALATVAGIVSLINDYRIHERMPTLGNLNYLLYANGVKGIKDVTSGGNPGCDTIGFLADEGWDPATGVGTLDFQEMLKN